jgi:hypothetical protein
MVEVSSTLAECMMSICLSEILEGWRRDWRFKVHFCTLNISRPTPQTRFVKHPPPIAQICSSEFFFYCFDMHDLILHLPEQVRGDSTVARKPRDRGARLTPKGHSDTSGYFPLLTYRRLQWGVCWVSLIASTATLVVVVVFAHILGNPWRLFVEGVPLLNGGSSDKWALQILGDCPGVCSWDFSWGWLYAPHLQLGKRPRTVSTLHVRSPVLIPFAYPLPHFVK